MLQKLLLQLKKRAASRQIGKAAWLGALTLANLVFNKYGA